MRTKLMLAGVATLVLLSATVAFAGREYVYVKVRAAKLRASTEAGDTRTVDFLPYGLKLEVLGEKDNYYEVKVSGVTGWIHKSQVQAKPPPEEAMASTWLTKQLTGENVTKVDDATKSAAGRGLLEAQGYAKARNLNAELEKMTKWLEALAPDAESLDLFWQEGRLGPYREE